MKKSSMIFLASSILSLANAQNWSEQTSNTTNDLLALHFPSSTVGYIVGKDGTILKSTNGGNNWSSIGTGYSGYWFWDVHFVTDQIGYIAGESDPGGNPSGDGIVLGTTNGGTTWTTLYSSTAHPLRDLFVVNTTIFASGGAESISGAESKIISSSNAGATWNQFTFNGTGNAGAVFGGMYFKDANNGFWGQYDFLDQAYWKSTTDACATISSQPIMNSISYFYFSSDFPTSNYGYFTRSTYSGTDPVYLRKTTDGGTTWIENPVAGFTGSFYDLDFIDQNNGYIVGGNGAILKTTNAGNTFSSQNSGVTDDLRSVQFINANLGFAVGANGTIIRYSLTSGINELSNAASPIIYPNPTENSISLNVDAINNVVEITNAQGQIVCKFLNLQNGEKIDLSAIPTGLYTLKLISNDLVISERFLKR